MDKPNNDGNRPIAIAFLNKHSNMATMLIDNKANVSCKAVKIDERRRKEYLEAKRLEKEKLK